MSLDYSSGKLDKAAKWVRKIMGSSTFDTAKGFFEEMVAAIKENRSKIASLEKRVTKLESNKCRCCAGGLKK